jgi:Domain of unknown function (DUF1906)
VSYGIDEAWERLSPAEMVAAGKTFVMGYVGEDTSGKNIGGREISDYLGHGIGVFLGYEYSTKAVHGGYSAGHKNGITACDQARGLGYPQGRVIAFAVDEDTSGNPGIVDDYSRGFSDVVHGFGYRSIVYGGYSTVKRCLDIGAADYGWQTYAWSGGKWDSRALIRQVSNGVVIGGKNVDLDIFMDDSKLDLIWRNVVELSDKIDVSGRNEKGKTVELGTLFADLEKARNYLVSTPEGAVQQGIEPGSGTVLDLLVQAAIRSAPATMPTAAEIASEIIRQLGKPAV